MGIFDFLGGIIKPITDLIDNLSTSDEEKLTLKNKLMDIQNQANAKLLEYESTIVKAKADIMVAELQQTDNYTKRARPTVIYGGLVILAINHVILPWVTFFQGMVLPAIVLPDAFWIAWGGICGVYAFGRTKEKIVDKIKEAK